MENDKNSKENFNDIVNVIAKESIKFLNKIYKAIQENRCFKDTFTNITNPFESKAIEQEPIEQKEVKKEVKSTTDNTDSLEIARKKYTSNRWNKIYEEAMIHASKETTPNKKRTITYLGGILPFTEDAIRRKAYRMGFKWKKGKLVDKRS